MVFPTEHQIIKFPVILLNFGKKLGLGSIIFEEFYCLMSDGRIIKVVF